MKVISKRTFTNEKAGSRGVAQAVIYARVSSVKQTVEGDGLRGQETRCRDFARRKGYQVEAVFQDDVSGSLTSRPGMKLMLAHLTKNKKRGTVVIIDDVSRLARGLEAHLALRAAIANAGGLLESPSIEFGDDPDSQLVEYLLATVSQHARGKNAQQTVNRMRARLFNGCWPFQAPVGYRFARVSGGGKLLQRDEPAALIVAEALEGFACGRFELQADVMRFLQDHPLFPKDRGGKVRAAAVARLLNQPLYAGYVEHEPWDISMRKGQHEPLVSFETYQTIQDRLNGKTREPWRPNINEDFPLRGFVACDDCGSGLTACWAKGRSARHPYYHCPKKGCASYGKSVRRADIEGEFELLLASAKPTPGLVKIAAAMFKQIWEARVAQIGSQGAALKSELLKIEKQITQSIDRAIATDAPAMIAVYEGKVVELTTQKSLVQERIANAGRPASSFDASLRTALDFLANPSKLWNSGSLEHRRAVLKLTFAGQLRYRRNEGFRTADLSLPFKALRSFGNGKSGMVRPSGFEPLTCGLEGRRSIQLS